MPRTVFDMKIKRGRERKSGERERLRMAERATEAVREREKGAYLKSCC